MDGQEYLNQISATTKPTQVKGGKFSFLKSKYFLLGAGTLVALIIIMIIGAILGSGKGNEKIYATDLLLHVNNTASVVEEYQPYIKSSELRGYSASFKSLLDVIGKDVEDYLKEKYDFKNADKEVAEEADEMKEELSNELFEAKINGYLDMTFAHKMTYETEMMITEMNKLNRVTKNDVLKGKLEGSHKSSLENLNKNFDDFSEAK